MAKTIFNTADLEVLETRLSRLTPQSARQFGKMTPSEMVCHLKDSLEIAMGAVPAEPKKSFVANPLVRWLIIYHLPWPKGGVETVPEMLATKPTEWNADLQKLRGLLKSAARRGANAMWAPSPAFGNLSGKDYGVLIHKHFDHHLGQFGV